MALWRPFAEHENEPTDLSRNAPIAEESPPQAFYRPLVLPVAPGYYVQYPYAPVYHQHQHIYYSPGRQPALVGIPVSPDTTQANIPSTSASALDDDEESLSGDPDYQAFENAAFQGLAEKNGGCLLGNNPRMRRAVQSQATSECNDSYRKQRDRNNHAAKQSRDRRKIREMRLAFQVSYLTKKVAEAKAKIAAGVCGQCGK